METTEYVLIQMLGSTNWREIEYSFFNHATTGDKIMGRRRKCVRYRSYGCDCDSCMSERAWRLQRYREQRIENAKPFKIFLNNNLATKRGFDTRAEAEECLKDTIESWEETIESNKEEIKKLRKNIRGYKEHACVLENVHIDKNGHIVEVEND